MSQLENLLQQCTVKLTVPGRMGWGTGFFVAPEWILTCAHVVPEAKGQPVRVRWQNQENWAEATVERSLPEPYDLALLRVTLPADANPPCVYLDEEIRSRDPLYLFGYPDQDFPNGCPVTFQCEGFTGDEPALIKFALGQVRPGMSGSPLLNQRTGKVCGIVKFTRDRSSNLGGGAVPTAVIFAQFPELVEQQYQFHEQDADWIISSLRIQQFLSWQCMGGGVGAGLGLGILRALLAPLHYLTPPVVFFETFWQASFLGAALTLGMALPIVLFAQKTSQLLNYPRITAIALGAGFFWIAHLILAFCNGASLVKAPLVAPMGFLAGLGLSVILSDQPWLRVAKINALLIRNFISVRPLLGAMAFALIQSVFIICKNLGVGIVIAWGSKMYLSNFNRYEWVKAFMQQYPQWYDYLALLDAALVGSSLTFGITIGLLLANRWLLKRQRSINH